MQANLVSSIACSSSTMCARSLESWEHSYVHQRWCFYQSLLAWEFEFGQISLTKLDLAHWVFLAIIKEQVAGAIQLMINFPSNWQMLTKQCTEAVKSPQGDPGSSEFPNKHTHPLIFLGEGGGDTMTNWAIPKGVNSRFSSEILISAKLSPRHHNHTQYIQL